MDSMPPADEVKMTRFGWILGAVLGVGFTIWTVCLVWHGFTWWAVPTGYLGLMGWVVLVGLVRGGAELVRKHPVAALSIIVFAAVGVGFTGRTFDLLRDGFTWWSVLT